VPCNGIARRTGTDLSKKPETELLEARDRLLGFAQGYDSAPETSALNAIWSRAKELGESASGSWLGYQANVYARDFKPPPPGVHFNIEHGLSSSYYRTSSQVWIEHSSHDVVDFLVDAPGKVALKIAETAAERGLEILKGAKADVASVLTIYLAQHDDPFVNRVAKEIEEAKVVSAVDFANDRAPKRQVITSDMRAVQQGTLVPPHVQVQARIVAALQPAAHCRELAGHLEKLAAHLSRVQRTETRGSRVGTNVFIGHGRSPVWRDLNDFVRDRLKLPHDEFNRVPVAGITNIARLSEMLEAAACAFVIMTAEDEQADGKVQARMNVIHEVGLFQGRLGFTKAIVLLEDGCEEFSNIQGLGQIRFPKGNLSAKFEEIRQVLEREDLLVPSP
jgi:predicted nucleotide-binding protein